MWSHPALTESRRRRNFMSLYNCHFIDLPKIENSCGNLTFIEAKRHVPFEIRRVYYLYDVPGGSQRGGHAHKELEQLIIAISGSFDIHLDDGVSRRTIHLNHSFQGFYICRMIWREIDNFSSGAVCMVLASLPFDENDYYRDYNVFVSNAKKSR